jgi:biopolymer transport protein ExbD
VRKCSKTVHHSLTELNITPLLDLGFVLLVIFIITTTPIVNDMDVKLPAAAQRQKEPPRKANYVTVDTAGTIYLNRKEVTLDGLLQELIQYRVDDPDLSVIVRGDSKTKYQYIVNILDRLQQANIVKVDLATEPLNEKPQL